MAGVEEELQALESAIIVSGTRTPSKDILQKYLKTVRELRIRESPLVAHSADLLLKNFKSGISEDEAWAVHEQLVIAALDIGDYKLAFPHLTAIVRRFPESIRARRLQGMYCEAKGDISKADEVYQSILKQDGSNQFALKRKIALENTQGNTGAAIDLLRKYLEAYQNDTEAWEELAELYLEVPMYRQAAFCYEELMMLSPVSAPIHVRYADVLYTLGGAQNLRTARTYYSRAVTLSKGHNVRALYGLLACTAGLPEKDVGRSRGQQAGGERVAGELAAEAAAALRKLYKKEAPSMLPLVEQLLSAQGL